MVSNTNRLKKRLKINQFQFGIWQIDLYNIYVAILSRQFVLGGKGAQIEIVENGIIRYFPFFGFNWKYLMG